MGALAALPLSKAMPSPCTEPPSNSRRESLSFFAAKPAATDAERVKPVGPRTPNLNAFVERWIQSLQLEALDHFIVCDETQFDHIVSQYVEYYRDCRPYRGIGNVLLPLTRGEPPTDEAEAETSSIKCDRRLDGLLKHYYRPA
jgi:hypothetical protein